MKASLVLFLLLTPVVNAGAESPGLLQQLGTDLQKARALPVGAKTAYVCPENLELLKGMAKTAISAALKEPDYQSENEHFYFLTSPVPKGQRGGGFPTITFTYEFGIVQSVTCNYAR